jgi:hypothetical protein
MLARHLNFGVHHFIFSKTDYGQKDSPICLISELRSKLGAIIMIMLLIYCSNTF